MKNFLSLIACFIICIVLVQYRVSYPGINSGKQLKITEWDAFGYYMYLPAIGIYHDVKELKWIPEIDKKYSLTGGDGYPAQKADNGNYVFKYLGGVAILQIPLFIAGQIIAGQTGYPQDGFSPPYQYALAFGVLLYCLLAILLLRKILLHYFSDRTTAITLLLVCLATNFIEYAAIDNGQSHAYIFPLYVLMLFSTMKWHQRPTYLWAALIGYILGLAAISRPTEAIMLFIPLFWDTYTKESAKAKWQLVKANKPQVVCAAIFGSLGILPQLIYWKVASGSFVYDVGSKWEFLNPHFRVLFGWEKGWFIYTPATLLFVAGMFFIKNFQFKRSVLWFCLLNIYIIIAWHDWRYGGSYSTRALMQSYPVFALPMAALVERATAGKWKLFFYALFAYLLAVNMFQVTQYCSTVLHFNDMNRKYYGRIYLNAHLSPTDMSLLDNDEVVNDESKYEQTPILMIDTPIHAQFNSYSAAILAELTIPNIPSGDKHERWIKIESDIQAPNCLWQSYLNGELQQGDSIKHSHVRLYSPISKSEAVNSYVCYMSIPATFSTCKVKMYIGSPFNFEGVVKRVAITELTKR